MNEFLGPHGQATIVLMRSHFDSELPKLKDLKKLLHIPDGKYYKSGGRYCYEISKLQRVLEIQNEIRGEERDQQKNRSTDYLVTVAEVHSNLFMTLKYTAQVIDGFNLNAAAMTSLEELMTNYANICRMRGDITHIWHVLDRNSLSSAKKGISDTTILNPDVPSLQKILAGYGDAEYAKVVKDIQDWYQTHRWKVKSSSKAKSTNEDDETEPAEVA